MFTEKDIKEVKSRLNDIIIEKKYREVKEREQRVRKEIEGIKRFIYKEVYDGINKANGCIEFSVELTRDCMNHKNTKSILDNYMREIVDHDYFYVAMYFDNIEMYEKMKSFGIRQSNSISNRIYICIFYGERKEKELKKDLFYLDVQDKIKQMIDKDLKKITINGSFYLLDKLNIKQSYYSFVINSEAVKVLEMIHQNELGVLIKDEKMTILNYKKTLGYKFYVFVEEMIGKLLKIN